MKKIISLFVILCILAISFNYYHQFILNLKELQINESLKKLTTKQVSQIILKAESIDKSNYLVIPAYILIKINLVAIILYLGAFIFNIKVKFKEILNITIRAEFVFLLPVLFEIIYFKFIRSDFTYYDVQYFSSLSLLSFTSYKNVEPWFIYPLQTLNFFELGYWLLLAYYIGKLSESTIYHGLKIVASSYGSALLLWVVIVMFFTLSYS